jgi:glutamate synthase domain-containing protein 1
MIRATSTMPAASDFIAHMKGEKSHQIVRDGLFMLENLTHRGAVGADPLMGDGAGMLVQIPDRAVPRGNGHAGRDPACAGDYAVGFLLHAAGRGPLRAIISRTSSQRSSPQKARC